MEHVNSRYTLLPTDKAPYTKEEKGLLFDDAEITASVTSSHSAPQRSRHVLFRWLAVLLAGFVAATAFTINAGTCRHFARTRGREVQREVMGVLMAPQPDIVGPHEAAQQTTSAAMENVQRQTMQRRQLFNPSVVFTLDLPFDFPGSQDSSTSSHQSPSPSHIPSTTTSSSEGTETLSSTTPTTYSTSVTTVTSSPTSISTHPLYSTSSYNDPSCEVVTYEYTTRPIVNPGGYTIGTETEYYGVTTIYPSGTSVCATSSPTPA